MGYYCEFAIVLTKHGHRKLRRNLAKLGPEERTSGRRFLDDAVRRVNGDFVFLYWNNVKFSTRYPEFRALRSSLDAVDASEYQYVRVGEDLGDIEVMGELWSSPFDLYPEQRIHYIEK